MSNSILQNFKRLEKTNKSMLYLYNLMQLPCIQPINTYFGFKDYDSDCTLVALYHLSIEDTKQACVCASKNKFYLKHFIDDEGYLYIIFEFFDISNVYDLIYKGKYSHIPIEFKALLAAHKDPLINYGIYPDLYFEDFAYEFEYPVDKIPKYNGTELMPPPDINSEYIVAPKSIEKELKELLVLV